MGLDSIHVANWAFLVSKEGTLASGKEGKRKKEKAEKEKGRPTGRCEGKERRKGAWFLDPLVRISPFNSSLIHTAQLLNTHKLAYSSISSLLLCLFWLCFSLSLSLIVSLLLSLAREYQVLSLSWVCKRNRLSLCLSVLSLCLFLFLSVFVFLCILLSLSVLSVFLCLSLSCLVLSPSLSLQEC